MRGRVLVRYWFPRNAMQFALVRSPRPSKEQADVALLSSTREQRSTVQVARVHLLRNDSTQFRTRVNFGRMNGLTNSARVSGRILFVREPLKTPIPPPDVRK